MAWNELTFLERGGIIGSGILCVCSFILLETPAAFILALPLSLSIIFLKIFSITLSDAPLFTNPLFLTIFTFSCIFIGYTLGGLIGYSIQKYKDETEGLLRIILLITTLIAISFICKVFFLEYVSSNPQWF